MAFAIRSVGDLGKNIKSLVVYLIPGGTLLIEVTYYYCKAFTNADVCKVWGYIFQKDASVIVITGGGVLFIIIGIGLGVFLEILRVTIIPRILPVHGEFLIKRRSVFETDPGNLRAI